MKENIRPLAEIFYGMFKGLPVPILREYAIRTNQKLNGGGI